MQQEIYEYKKDGNKYKCIFHSEDQKEKVAVIFPGRGYNTKRPLLYYAKMVMAENGYDVLELDYGTFKDRQDMPDAAPQAVEISLKAIQAFKVMDYKEIVFISKSFGTIVSGIVAQQLDKTDEKTKIRQLFMTPLRETLPYMTKQNWEAIIGTDDKYTRPEEIHALGWDTDPRVHLSKMGSHALEVKNQARESVKRLEEVVDICIHFAEKKG